MSQKKTDLETPETTIDAMTTRRRKSLQISDIPTLLTTALETRASRAIPDGNFYRLQNRI